MTWLWMIFTFGVLPMAVLVTVSIGLLLYFAGTIGLDGVFVASETPGTLTCWHCQQETKAGLRHCHHCGGELQ